METFLNYLKWSPYLVASFSLAAFFLDLSQGSKRDPKETWTNFRIWASGRVVRTFLTAGVLAAIVSPVYEIVAWKIPFNGWTLLLALFVADFTYYWQHRLSHHVGQRVPQPIAALVPHVLGRSQLQKLQRSQRMEGKMQRHYLPKKPSERTSTDRTRSIPRRGSPSLERLSGSVACGSVSF